MTAGDWFYIGQSINPIAGLLVSVPWAVLKMHYPLWLVVVSAPPLAYLQVVGADLLWNYLKRITYVKNLLEKKHSPRVQKLFASGGRFIPVFIATPLVGPWLVMLVMRYANVTQRHVMLPIMLALVVVSFVLGLTCLIVPTAFS